MKTKMSRMKELEIIAAIASRAVRMARKYGVDYQQLEAVLDLSNCHDRRPLRLMELLQADDGNFGHDIFGIRRHINRETGEMEDGFLPRYSA